jgi:hypothetical protein
MGASEIPRTTHGGFLRSARPVRKTSAATPHSPILRANAQQSVVCTELQKPVFLKMFNIF